MCTKTYLKKKNLFTRHVTLLVRKVSSHYKTRKCIRYVSIYYVPDKTIRHNKALFKTRVITNGIKSKLATVFFLLLYIIVL